MAKQKHSSKPVGEFPNRMDFILDDKEEGRVVINNYGGGMFKGFVANFFGIDKSNTYFAVINNMGNHVWLHKRNCAVLSWGDTLNSINK